MPGTKLILRDAELVDGVILLTAAHVHRVCGRVESLARAAQLKSEADTLRQKMFRAALEDGEEPPPAFTVMEIKVWYLFSHCILQVWSFRFYLCFQYRQSEM